MQDVGKQPDDATRALAREIKYAIETSETLAAVANVLHAYNKELDRLNFEWPRTYDYLMNLADQTRDLIRARTPV